MSNTTMGKSAEQHEWSEAAEKAKESAACAGESAGHAASAVGAMVGKQVDDLTATAGAGIQEWGDRLSQNVPQSGLLGGASQAVARSVRDSGEYIHEAKLSGMVDDLATLVKRNPIPSVMMALCLGWCIGRRVGR
jgi:hypothetical protein